MSNLTLTPKWDSGVYQWEIDDPVEGGPDGVDNKPPKNLGNRSEFLKKQLDDALVGNLGGGIHLPNGEIDPLRSLSRVTNNSDMVDGFGRDLVELLRVSTSLSIGDRIKTAFNEFTRLLNNNQEIDGSGRPYLQGFEIGDRITKLDLSAIAAENGGSAGQVWNETYRNNEIILSGLNTYKHMGDTENTKNHLLFTFRNIPLKYRMNPANDNAGGYIASDMRAFLEGLNGDGTGDKDNVTTAAFMTALAAQIGAGHLYKIRKGHSKKSDAAWARYTVFLPSELEVFGFPVRGDEGVYMPALTSPVLPARAPWLTPIQMPIYQKSFVYRVKRYNGARDWWWEQTPDASSAAIFAFVHNNGNASGDVASSVGGCAPAFCVA
jgi:hypothetical protein